jgi:hypothetical protein
LRVFEAMNEALKVEAEQAASMNSQVSLPNDLPVCEFYERISSLGNHNKLWPRRCIELCLRQY